MLNRNKDGLYYVSDNTGKRYQLDQGYGIKGNELRSSDIFYIIDSGLTEEEYENWMNNPNSEPLQENFVGWSYGAGFLDEDDEDTIEIIKEIIDEYESKEFYDLEEEEVQEFCQLMYDYIYEKLDRMYNGEKLNIGDLDVKISIGNYTISVPANADYIEGLECYLRKCVEDEIEYMKQKIKEDPGIE